MNVEFETFREMLAWGKIYALRIAAAPQRCQGLIKCEDADVVATLTPSLASLGFERTAGLVTGSFCGLFRRNGEDLITSSDPGTGDRSHAFNFGGQSSVSLRRVLGELALRPGVSVIVDEWTPEL